MVEPEVSIIYIDSPTALVAESKEWANLQIVGVDLECENNLHHYGAYISLIQLSSKRKNWVVDVLKLGEVKPVLELLENRKVEKIFHDVSFDFRILNYQFGCHPKNIFDTQIAAVLLGKTELGLGPLLEHYFHKKKEVKFQMADWTKRPLTMDMLNYASHDTVHLIELRNILKGELSRLGRLSWAEEEFRSLESKEFEYHDQNFFDIKGLSKLSDSQRAILKRLTDVRETLAKRVNRPIHFIISTKRLFELAQNPPKSVGDWAYMKGVHPIVKMKANLLFDAVSKGKKESLPMPKHKKYYYSVEQKQEFQEISEAAGKIAERLNLPKHVILSKDQARDVVLGNLSSLSNWQREILQKEGLKYLN